MVNPLSTYLDMEYSASGLLCIIWQGGSPTLSCLSSVSLDGGITWAYQVVVSDSPGSTPNRPGLAADSSGNLYACWEDHRGPEPYAIYFSKSTDQGQTWSSNTRVSDPGNLAASPDIACSIDGSLLVVAYNRIDETRIYATCSADGGETWSPDVPVGDEVAASQYFVSTCWVGGSSFLCCWLDARSPGISYLWASHSGDGGANWSQPNTPVPSGGHTPAPHSIKFCWSPPFVHMSWIEEYWTADDPFKEVYYSRSGDGGLSWLPEAARVDSGGSSVIRHWGGVWSGNSEQVYVAWKQTIGGEPGLFVLCSSSSDSGQSWTVPVVVNTESREAFRCCLTGNRATGELYVSWSNNSDKEVWFSRGIDDTGVQGSPEQLPGIGVYVTPNPCFETTSISTWGIASVACLSIVDLSGRCLLKVSIADGETYAWDTSDVQPGVYAILLSCGDRRAAAKAVIVH